MAESDKALCARLAKWMGLDDVRMGVLAYWFTPTDCGYTAEPQRLDGMHRMSKDAWVYKARELDNRQQWHCRDSGYEVVPAYDTDPADALELLDWLAEEGWDFNIRWCAGTCQVIFTSTTARPVVSPSIDAPPSTALPEAIARAAEKVRESEENDETT